MRALTSSVVSHHNRDGQCLQETMLVFPCDVVRLFRALVRAGAPRLRAGSGRFPGDLCRAVSTGPDWANQETTSHPIFTDSCYNQSFDFVHIHDSCLFFFFSCSKNVISSIFMKQRMEPPTSQGSLLNPDFNASHLVLLASKQMTGDLRGGAVRRSLYARLTLQVFHIVLTDPMK